MAHVKLILLQDVEDLGLAGEEVHVAAGYARNYLIPRGFATVASTGVLRQLEARKEKIEAKRKADLEAAQALSAKIASLDITIPMQASEDGHLFGSVSERTIFEKLASMDVKVNINKIRLDAPIRTIGEFKVDIKLHQSVTAVATIKVVGAA